MSNNESAVVKHLHGNFYLVRSDYIQFVEKNNNKERYYNPRLVNNEALGLDQEPMRILKESIMGVGLQHPIGIRAFGENLGERKFDLLNGERRLRCIDKLKEENASCYCSTKKAMVPAKEAYEYILCNIYTNISDKEAFRIAMGANNGEPIGETAEVANVKNWLEWGWGENEIKECTGKSIVWVRETIGLTQLDAKTFEKFVKRFINRAVAIKLSEIKDVPLRHKLLETTIRLGQQRSKVLLEQKVEEVEEASRKSEIKEAEFADAVALDGNKEEKKAELEVSKHRLAVKKGELATIKEKKPAATIKDLNKAHKEIGEKKAISLSDAKIKRCWIEPLKDILRMDNKEKHEFSTDDAKLVVRLFDHSIPNGVEDIFELLKDHQKSK